MDQLRGMSGPEFLEAVADQERGHGNNTNAGYFDERARQWQRDQQELIAARQAVQDLTDRLQHIAQHARAAPQVVGSNISTGQQ